jgi:hypothetical protein
MSFISAAPPVRYSMSRRYGPPLRWATCPTAPKTGPKSLTSEVGTPQDDEEA